MNTPTKREPKSYRLSFIINTVGGGFMLLLSVVAYFIEMSYPTMRGKLVWGAMLPAVLSLFFASLDYSRYLNSKK
jgi:hypothetical protein